jgi:hypothetical protein
MKFIKIPLLEMILNPHQHYDRLLSIAFFWLLEHLIQLKLRLYDLNFKFNILYLKKDIVKKKKFVLKLSLFDIDLITTVVNLS